MCYEEVYYKGAAMYLRFSLVVYVTNLQVNTLWGSFEISNVRLAKVMLQQFAG